MIEDPPTGHVWTTASAGWAGLNGGRLYCVTCSEATPREDWGTERQVVWARQCTGRDRATAAELRRLASVNPDDEWAAADAYAALAPAVLTVIEEGPSCTS